MLGRFGTIIIIAIDLNLEIRLNVSLVVLVSSHLHWAYVPINIRPYYHLDKQRWGLIARGFDSI